MGEERSFIKFKSLRLWLVDIPCVVLFLALALGPWTALFGSRVDLGRTLSPPSALHPFGTDNLGRDLLARASEAVRGGVLPLWAGVALGTVAGTMLALAGIVLAERRRVRPAVQAFDAFATALASIPVGITAFAWAAVQQGAGLWPVLLSLSALFTVRAYLQARDLHRHDERLAFWTAHAALGGSLFGRLWRYGVVSGWRRALLDALGFHLRAAVAIEASLSYLGFGLQEPHASFGNMLASHFDLYLKGQWHVLWVIAAALAVTAAFPAAATRLSALRPRRRNQVGSAVSLGQRQAA